MTGKTRILKTLAGEATDSLPLREGRAAMGERQMPLGNINPVRTLHDGTPESVTAEIAECHAQAGTIYIVAAGCEVPRGTPEANVLAMTHYARNH